MRWRNVSKCCCARTVVGREDGDLFAFHHRLEGGANRDLGFAEADVAADQAIHRARLFHVALRFGDRLELVGRFPEGKGMLELELPFRVGAESVAELGLALGLQGEHFAGVIENRGSRVLLRPRPFRVGQRTERRRFFPDPDVARNQEGLLERDVEFRFVGELDRETFDASAAARGRPAPFPLRRYTRSTPRRPGSLQSEETADAVLEMDDEIAFVELAEIDLSAVRAELRGALQTAPPCVGARPKSSAAASTTRLAAGKQKPRASVPSSNSIPPNEISGLRHDFAKTFDLAFGLEVNCDPCSALAPGREAGKELLPFRLRDDELAGVEFADLAIDKGTTEIFDLVGVHGVIPSRMRPSCDHGRSDPPELSLVSPLGLSIQQSVGISIALLTPRCNRAPFRSDRRLAPNNSSTSFRLRTEVCVSRSNSRSDSISSPKNSARIGACACQE